jgi:phosphate transport system protein
MARTTFERHLDEIEEDMLVLAGMVERAIDRSIDALKNRDTELARVVIVEDMDINRKRYETEEKCLELLALQQPMAVDLRKIVAILHIIVDLERMGDHAEGIAKVAIMLADEPPLKPYIDIPRMAEIAVRMLRGGLESFKLERATHITWIAHNLERIADRVTNICERVVYMVQGTIEELNVSKY